MNKLTYIEKALLPDDTPERPGNQMVSMLAREAHIDIVGDCKHEKIIRLGIKLGYRAASDTVSKPCECKEAQANCENRLSGSPNPPKSVEFSRREKGIDVTGSSYSTHPEQLSCVLARSTANVTGYENHKLGDPDGRLKKTCACGEAFYSVRARYCSTSCGNRFRKRAQRKRSTAAPSPV